MANITFSEYLRRIAAPYFEKAYRAGKRIAGLLNVIGAALEAWRTELGKALNQFSAKTAEGVWLDRHGADTGWPRLPGESDADYRAFLLALPETCRYLGGAANLEAILLRYGFTAVVTARWTGYGPQGPADYDRADWNVFEVYLSHTAGIAPEGVFFNLVRRCKPAHTTAVFLFAPEMNWQTWDPNPARTFDDGGTYDSF